MSTAFGSTIPARPIGSVEYVRVKITETSANPAELIDAASVELAFTTGAAPTTWLAATWEGAAAKTRVARILAGPGQTFVPTATNYLVWYRFTDIPEIPARPAAWIRFA